MSRPVKSTDLRKAPLVAALKKKSGASRVTCVTEHIGGVFTGSCMASLPGHKGFMYLGTFSVTESEMQR